MNLVSAFQQFLIFYVVGGVILYHLPIWNDNTDYSKFQIIVALTFPAIFSLSIFYIHHRYLKEKYPDLLNWIHLALFVGFMLCMIVFTTFFD